MNDLEQFEVEQLQEEERKDMCESRNHQLNGQSCLVERHYSDGAFAIICMNCMSCTEFVDAEGVEV